jgi:hypothetical protein
MKLNVYFFGWNIKTSYVLTRDTLMFLNSAYMNLNLYGVGHSGVWVRYRVSQRCSLLFWLTLQD